MDSAGRERPEWAGDSSAIHRRPPIMFNLKKKCCTMLMTSIEKCRFESPLWHCLFMDICLIFYSYYIVPRGYIYIYIYTPWRLWMLCTYSIVLFGYITNLHTLRLRGLHSDSNRRPFAPQADVLSVTPSYPEAHCDIFGYILAFPLISIRN